VSMQGRVGEFARYAATGLFGVTVNAGGVALLTESLHLHYLVSLAAVSAFVTLAGFALNKYWTFRRRNTQVVPELARYVTTTALNIVIGIVCCAALVEVWDVPYVWAVALVGVGFAPLTYLAHRGWSFGLPWLYGR
jgi:putative flippase GtrA